MIYLTGDTHRTVNIEKLKPSHFKIQKNLTKEDYLIICGDFGGVWDKSKISEQCIEFHNTRNYTTLFVDGNHENFDLLNSYPVTKWKGGKVHQIAEHVYHLMRGQVFEIDGFKFFTMGGGISVDKEFRMPGRTWWPQEDLSCEEIEEAVKNLDQHHWKVDYILTHTASNRMMKECFGFQKEESRINEFLDMIQMRLEYKWWFFGHFHEDEVYETQRCTCLFNQIRRLDQQVVK